MRPRVATAVSLLVKLVRCKHELAKEWVTYRAHGKANDCAYITTTSNGAVPRQESREVGASRHGVGGNVGSQLGEGKAGRNDKNAKALSRVGSLEVHAQQGQGIPHVLAKDDAGRRGDKDANQGSNGKADGNCDELRPNCILGLAGVPSKVRVVDDQGRKVSDAAHDALDKRPRQNAACNRVGLVNDRTNAVCANNGPGKEGDGAGW